jgi:hypothetical protein
VSALSDEIRGAVASALTQHRLDRLDDVIARLEAIERRLPPLLVGYADAARILKVSVPTVKRRALAGELPTTRIGSRVLVDVGRLHGLDGDDIARLAAGARSDR